MSTQSIGGAKTKMQPGISNLVFLKVSVLNDLMLSYFPDLSGLVESKVQGKVKGSDVWLHWARAIKKNKL